MRLHTAGSARGFRKPIVARVATEPVPVGARKDTALVLSSLDTVANDFRGYAAIIVQRKVEGQRISNPLVHSVLSKGVELAHRVA